MKSFLDELEVPQPPYRMARLAMAETPQLTPADVEQVINQIKPEKTDEERAQELGAQRLAEQDKEWEAFATPEQVHAKVDTKADELKHEVNPTPLPDTPIQAEAKESIEKVRTDYDQEVAPREGRTPEQVVTEFKGEGKKLESVEDEYESTEAALRRAEKAKDQKEIERLTKLAQSYNDVLEKKNTPPVTEQGIPYYEKLKVEALKKKDYAQVREMQRIINNYKAAAQPTPESAPAPKPVDEDRKKLEEIRAAATKAVTEKSAPTAQEIFDAASKQLDTFRNKKTGTLSKGVFQNPAYRKARDEYDSAFKVLHPEQPTTPEPVPPKPENPDETINQKPQSTLELTDDEKSLRSIRNRQATLRAQGKNDEADSWELRAKELEDSIQRGTAKTAPSGEKQNLSEDEQFAQQYGHSVEEIQRRLKHFDETATGDFTTRETYLRSLLSQSQDEYDEYEKRAAEEAARVAAAKSAATPPTPPASVPSQAAPAASAPRRAAAMPSQNPPPSNVATPGAGAPQHGPASTDNLNGHVKEFKAFERKRNKDFEKAIQEDVERSHEEALKKEIGLAYEEAKPEEKSRQAKQAPSPEQPENPRRERMGGIIGFLREGLRWTIEKTGVRPWLDTLGLRLKAKFHYRMAEVRMMQQSRAQNKLENATLKLDDWTARMQDAGFPMRLFYSNRVRKWQARANSAEARVDKLDTLRQGRQDRHNELQRQVAARYDRELAPYQEKMNVLKTKESSLLQARKSLEGIRNTAVKEFAQLRAQATKKHWWQSTAASVEVKRAEKAIKDIEERIKQANKEIDRLQGPLEGAKTNVDKWELKKDTVAQLMKFPEAAGLQRPKRKEVSMPERRGVEGGATEAPAEAAPASPTEAERFAEEWSPDDFVKRWNGNNLKPEIERPEEFTKFVAAERTRLKQVGTPKLGQLLDIAEQYLRTRSSAKDIRQFSKDRRFFIANIQKQ